jgi:hypothetical protein
MTAGSRAASVAGALKRRTHALISQFACSSPPDMMPGVIPQTSYASQNQFAVQFSGQHIRAASPTAADIEQHGISCNLSPPSFPLFSTQLWCGQILSGGFPADSCGKREKGARTGAVREAVDRHKSYIVLLFQKKCDTVFTLGAWLPDSVDFVCATLGLVLGAGDCEVTGTDRCRAD